MEKPNSQSSLDCWIDWLLNLHAEEIDLGLERISLVANKMQVTRPAPLVVSVAGTNGKGSSVAMLSAILEQAGYKVGTYTSPHIVSFTERVKINSQPVSAQMIVDAFDLIEGQRSDIKLTYFEFSTLAALTIFNQSDLDIVVLEVGLGGRLDAVNTVDADACLISAIDIDHIEWLGSDRNVIAVEKAGIMRKNAIAVCSDATVPATLVDYAQELGAKLSLLGRDYRYVQMQKKNENSSQVGESSWLFQSSQSEQSLELPLPALKGEFQLQNAAGVLELLLQISDKWPVSVEAIKQGLLSVKHPGRMELRQLNDQAWLIDVAHNPQSAQALAQTLQQEDLNTKRVAIFSALSDKDMLPMVEEVKPFVSQWVISDLATPRSTSIDGLKEILFAAGIGEESITECSTIAQAVEKTLDMPSKKVLVWGSFFTVAQVIERIEGLDV